MEVKVNIPTHNYPTTRTDSYTRANIPSHNGKRMEPGDKRNAILIALKEFSEKSQTQIAEQVGCAQSWVSDIKKQVIGTDNLTSQSTSGDTPELPDRVTGKDGKSYPARKPKPEPELETEDTTEPEQEIAEQVGCRKENVTSYNYPTTRTDSRGRTMPTS